MSCGDGIWITTLSSSLRTEGVHRLDERLHVLRRRGRLDAVAEIEDVTGLVTDRLERRAGSGDERLLGTEEQGRVEVSLQRHARELAARLLERDAPVERDDVVAEAADGREVRRHAGGEEDGRDSGLAERLGDAGE